MKIISCIIPIYGLATGNNFLYFEELLCSISKASKFLGNQFELIIINDDKDRIFKHRVIEFCSKYGLEKVLIYKENEHNSGQAYSRNVGASFASGRFLHFIDQDDFISYNFYEISSTLSSDVDLMIAEPYFFKDGFVKEAYTKLLKSAYKNAKTIKELWYLLISNVVYSPGQALISKRAFEVGCGFPVLNNRGADDFAFFYKLVFSGVKIPLVFSERSKFYYRIHSLQNSKLSSTNVSACEFLKDYRPNGIKQKIVQYSKTLKCMGYLSKLFYILYYKRA